MKTIALETSSQPGALALLDGEDVRLTLTLPAKRRTTEVFAEQIRNALKDAEWSPSDVELFAVCEGPGSFTGLRIGITAAKVFAYATECEVVAVNTLEVLADQALMGDEPIWSTLDAQRRQLFVGEFKHQGEQLEQLTATQVVDAHEWISALPPGTHVTGTGLKSWRSELPEHANVTPESAWDVCPVRLGQLAVKHHALGHVADIWKLVPRYYRQSAAEEKLSLKKQGRSGD